MRQRTVLVLCLVILGTGIVGTVVLFPRLRVKWLASKLNTSETAEEAAMIARQILESRNVGALDAVDAYAAKSLQRGFDKRHGVLLINDPSSGDVHVVYTGRAGYVDTDNPALPKAIEAAIPKMSSQKMSFGDPLIRYLGVRCVESTESETIFVLKPVEGNEYAAANFVFRRGSLTIEGSIPVTGDQIERWRDSGTWPEGW